MLILLRFMETHGVALGYVGDKIRYIVLIRVRFTTEFFFEHGFIGLTRMLRSWWYCLPDSSHYMSWKSRDFVPGYSRCARYCLPDKAGCSRNASLQQPPLSIPVMPYPH